MRIGCLLLLLPVVIGLLPSVKAQQTAVPIAATVVTYLTACTDPSMPPALPNLSFGTRSDHYSYTGIPSCTPPPTSLSNTYFVPKMTFTWYYYENYEAQATPTPKCSHSKTTSTLQVQSSQANTLSGPLITVTRGMVSGGAYAGKSFTYTTTSNAYPPACTSAAGLETRGGVVTLEIEGGPTCQGSTVQGFCPGLRNPAPAAAGSGLPVLGPMGGAPTLPVGGPMTNFG